MLKHKSVITKLVLPATILAASFFVNACNENPGESTLGQKYVNSQTELDLIDTFSVNLSTVIMDTVTTSNTGVMLVGNYSDDVFGKISSRSFFQIGKPDYTYFDIVQASDKFDSLKLVIRYNKYSFGDTTKSQRLSVYQLTENIEPNDNDVLTGETVFNYNPSPVGTIVYTPEPHNTIDTLSIRIKDEIGLDLLEKLKDKSEILSDGEQFENYFHGLMLAASNAGAVIGFYASDTDVKLILYTSRGDASSDDEEITYKFALEDKTRQFNNITHDFSSTQLSELTKQQNSLSCTQTGGLSFMQGGIEVAIRADFPSLSEILLRDRGTIIKAELSLAPLSGSYKNFNLPSELVAGEVDAVNRKTGSSFAATSQLQLDELYQEETVYTFDITKLVNSAMSASYFDPEKGLLISLPEYYMQTTFSRLIANAQNRKTKLKIYYLSY